MALVSLQPPMDALNLPFQAVEIVHPLVLADQAVYLAKWTKNLHTEVKNDVQKTKWKRID